MSKRDFKHTGFQEDDIPPFHCAPIGRPAPPQQGAGKLVTRILATVLAITLVVFFAAQALIRHL